MTRYKVDVGEEFPLSDDEREGRCSRYDGACAEKAERWREAKDHSHGFRAPKLLMLFAVVALGVALIATAASYPLATLAAAAVLFLFAREHFDGRGHRHHRGHRHGRRNAA